MNLVPRFGLATLPLLLVTSFAQVPPRTTTFPADVQQKIQQAAKTGDVIVINGDWSPPATSADYVVVKADTFTIASGANIMVPKKIKWIAFVAKTWKFAEPTIRTQIWSPPLPRKDGPAYSDMPTPPEPPKHNHGSDGDPGIPGANGRRGQNGTIGYSQPTIYLIANAVVNQAGTPLPSGLSLRIFAPGGEGGRGGPGQNGQNGGVGGSGGDGVADLLNPRSAGNGGPGGIGGIGGRGGDGQSGGSGADVYYVGSDRAVDLFEFTIVDNPKGQPGGPGDAGHNGAPGSGGPRGSHPGNSGGGSGGPGAPPQTAAVNRGNPGPDNGKQGLIYSIRGFDVNSLF